MLAHTFKALLLIASLLVMETSLGGGSFQDQGFVTGSLTADGGVNRFGGTKPESDDQPAAQASEPYTNTTALRPVAPVAAPTPAIAQRIAGGHPIRAPPLHLML